MRIALRILAEAAIGAAVIGGGLLGLAAIVALFAAPMLLIDAAAFEALGPGCRLLVMIGVVAWMVFVGLCLRGAWEAVSGDGRPSSPPRPAPTAKAGQPADPGPAPTWPRGPWGEA